MDLVFNNLTGDKFLKEIFFRKVLNTAIKEANLKNKNLGISLNLVTENKIQELNKKYRNKDKITDVLSFPMQSKPFDYAQGPTSNASAFDVGDIFICLSFAKKQAKLENVSIERKLTQLAVHGFLHLLGYDHEKSEREAKKMLSIESRIFDKLNY